MRRLRADRSRRAIGPELFRQADVRGKAVLVHTGWSEHWGTERYFHGHPFRARAHSHAVVMWQIVAMNAASRSPLLASSTGASLTARVPCPAGSRLPEDSRHRPDDQDSDAKHA